MTTVTARLRARADHAAAARKAEAAARRAQQVRAVEAARAEWEALMQRALAEFARYPRGQAPRELWEAVGSRRYRRRREAPAYKRPGDCLRWYRREIAAWRKALGEE
jgi:hypothetical protein